MCRAFNASNNRVCRRSASTGVIWIRGISGFVVVFFLVFVVFSVYTYGIIEKMYYEGAFYDARSFVYNSRTISRF